ncbi:DUF2891 domain-containing protein [Lewinella sp. 4G2]|uniref:DUF2891 domain-containing protein n=1 Tax=Lewinella sp. 4G2 TaxID=1803372 RepID=UPI0007B4E52C|nr:DUF2891 domain-containing protein [Lewinella sp. 4G2]OAV43644.1 hypothetical protein A3850_003645 [Lewinella sp. 4G2]
MLRYLPLLLLLTACTANDTTPETETPPMPTVQELTLAEANRLADLPLECLQQPLPYKSGVILAKEEDLAMPRTHHPAFYGCFDWHSAVHGHWSLVYLLKRFPELERGEEARRKLAENLTAENIRQEIAYFSMNKESASFERTYGWAWLLKLQEELDAWDDPAATELATNLRPLTGYISQAYQTYLPKLSYPIRVGEHSNTAFGLSFAHDYATSAGDAALLTAIETAARRFYLEDAGCPIGWEPSGYDFLSPCLQELDLMRKVLPDAEFTPWAKAFLPGLFDGTLNLEPGRVKDRSDGKLVHLDGLNFSRAWCLYSIDDPYAQRIANTHLAYSLEKITDGDYAGQHWLASFALYAFEQQRRGQ